MKLRLFTGLALALALGGCASYGYVGDGGSGYYTGGASTRYVYPAYSYGYGGYGSSYYRYSPGLSFGLGYGSPYGYGGYGYGYYPRYPAYPPYYHSRPSHPPRPRPDQNGPGHGGRPDRPPVSGGPPPRLDRAPWRDLERLRRGDGENDGPRRRQPGPGTLGVTAPYPVTGQPGVPGGAKAVPPSGVNMGGPRFTGMNEGDRPVNQARPASSPRTMQRAAPRASESRRSGPNRSATRDTDEP
jgi:hypothetical protein